MSTMSPAVRLPPAYGSSTVGEVLPYRPVGLAGLTHLSPGTRIGPSWPVAIRLVAIRLSTRSSGARPPARLEANTGNGLNGHNYYPGIYTDLGR